MKMKKTLSLAVAAAFAVPSFSAFAMEQSRFDSGMKKGIEYFSKGLYYEARDEFQWFADYNWGELNDGQQKYLLDYLDGAKQNIANLSKAKVSAETNMPTGIFDNGMRKGIEYFNKGLYYEAKDEFQWFCDANWGRMNEGQQKYVLDYLGAAKQKISTLNNITLSDYNGNYQNSAYIGRWQATISSATTKSIVFSISQSESDYEVRDVVLTRQSNGSYKGNGISSGRGRSYFTVWLENSSRISVTISGDAEQTGTQKLYK